MIDFSVADRVNGVQEYYFAKKLRQIEQMNKDGKNVINLGIGSPDRPPHPDVIKTLYEESLNPRQHGYQNYKGHIKLREAASAWYDRYYHVSVDPNSEIIPLMGSKEGIMHICMTYINPGDGVLIPDPGYPTYKSAATVSGAALQTYQLTEANDWYPDFEELESRDLSGVKLMFVNYPQMPTGKAPEKELFQKLVDFARRNEILICHDNPYSFILNDNPLSMLSVEGAKDVVIELNSLSKSHNMAGWRIGFVIAAEQRINEIMRFKSQMDSGMFLPAQLAAAKALSLGKEWYDEVNRVYRQRREKVYEMLELLGTTFTRNQSGLFVWAKAPAQYTSGYELSDKILEEANVFLTPGGIFGVSGEGYIRISLCANEDAIKEAIERIKATGITNK